MYDGDELLVHTGNLSMQSALGFYSNGSFEAIKNKEKDAFTEYIKNTKTGKVLRRAGMLGGAPRDDDEDIGDFPIRKTEDKG